MRAKIKLEAERRIKKCTRCGIDKPFSEFAKHKGSPHGLDYWCRPCHKANSKKFRDANPERSRAASRKWQAANQEKFKHSQRKRDLRIKYGITVEQWDAMFAAQKGLCAICGRPPRTTGGHGHYRFMVDHCHATNAIRGLVHNKCNLMLGYADDDPAILQAAIEYLGRYPQKGVE